MAYVFETDRVMDTLVIRIRSMVAEFRVSDDDPCSVFVANSGAEFSDIQNISKTLTSICFRPVNCRMRRLSPHELVRQSESPFSNFSAYSFLDVVPIHFKTQPARA